VVKILAAESKCSTSNTAGCSILRQLHLMTSVLVCGILSCEIMAFHHPNLQLQISRSLSGLCIGLQLLNRKQIWQTWDSVIHK